jgi:hypothetical protein
MSKKKRAKSFSMTEPKSFYLVERRFAKESEVSGRKKEQHLCQRIAQQKALCKL